MKINATKMMRPKMAESALIKARLRDEEDMIQSMPPMKHEGMSEDRGPEEDEYDAQHFAEGGKVNKQRQGAQESRKYQAQKSEKGVHVPKRPYPGNKESMGESQAGYYTKSGGGVEPQTGKKVTQADMNEDAKDMHREKLEELRSMPKPRLEGMAEGGMIHDEEEMEHHDSVAAAIMARRRKMADGGMVDIDSNAEEQPNQMDKLNRAALKENYDSDVDSIHEPMDSIGDSREDDMENKLDMVSAIRRKMKMKQGR